MPIVTEADINSGDFLLLFTCGALSEVSGHERAADTPHYAPRRIWEA